MGVIASSAQENIEVQIFDHENQPLPGANIYASDQSFAAISEADGTFLLPPIDPEITIFISYLGLEAIETNYEALRQNPVVRFETSSTALEQVLIVGRRDDQADQIVSEVVSIQKRDIDLLNPQTSADALEAQGGLFVQKSQMGGGSPIIRGFEANRVLLVVDGVRMNNAIYRNGHLQNSITVDPSMLAGVEVIFGPGSLTYGSDALGGVVHFRTLDPRLNRTETNYFLRTSSANFEKTAHVDINIGGSRWSSLTSLTFTDFDDLIAGKNRPDEYPDFGRRLYYAERQNGEDVAVLNENSNVQVGTGYHQYDLMQKIRFQANNSFYIQGNFQYSSSSDIPRYDQLTELNSSDPADLRFAEWYYGPQDRFMASLSARQLKATSWYDRYTLIGSYQRIREERISRRFGRSNRERHTEWVDVLGLTADFDKQLDDAGRFQLAYGLDIQHNLVASEATITDVDSDETEVLNFTRYPSQGSQLSTWGVYARHTFRSQDSIFIWNTGVRVAGSYLQSKFGIEDQIAWPASYISPGVQADNHNLSWSTGFRVNTPDRWLFRILAASAFRAPNVDDFGKIRAKGGFVTIPNPDLEAEQAITLEATIGKTFIDKGRWEFQLSGTGFHTFLQDAMVRVNAPLPDGSSFLVMDGDSLITQANVNAKSGRIFGLSGNVVLRFSNWMEVRSGLSFTKGTTDFQNQIVDTLVPLTHIPPIYGTTSCRLQFGKWTALVQLQYQGAKPVERYGVSDIVLDPDGSLRYLREGTSDNIELGVVEFSNDSIEYSGTYAWARLDLRLQWRLAKQFQLQAGVENILDQHYRTFASGVSGAGRNFSLGIRGTF